MELGLKLLRRSRDYSSWLRERAVKARADADKRYKRKEAHQQTWVAMDLERQDKPFRDQAEKIAWEKLRHQWVKKKERLIKEWLAAEARANALSYRVANTRYLARVAARRIAGTKKAFPKN
jgi:hypothetical protein